MRLKIDENLEPALAELLREAGHDADTVYDEQMRGARDTALARACLSDGRTLITLDKGFADTRRYAPEAHAGFVVLRLSHQSRRSVRAVIERLVPLFEGATLAGKLWIVDETSVRIRPVAEGDA